MYVDGNFIGVKPECYFGQFRVKDFYCTINIIILNIYPCVISRKYKRQDITLVHEIIDVDGGGRMICHFRIFKSTLFFVN